MSQKAKTTQATKPGTSASSPKSIKKTKTTKKPVQAQGPIEDVDEFEQDPFAEDEQKEVVQAAPEMVEEIEEVERVPKGVIQNMADLENKLIMALNADVKKLLVTPGIIRAILQQRYKDDPYMIYRNVELYDYNRVEETELRNAETINDRIFGKSKVNIGSNPPPQGPAA